ncbi:MAG: hypothetical protein JNM70_13845 [Anaerolineae bacterium]|nr:hypothetical protein [Anaerolineae bacterium]
MNRITATHPVVWMFVTALTIVLLALLAGFAQIQSLADARAAAAIPAGDLSIEARAAVLLFVLGAVAGVVVVAGLIATRVISLVYDIRARRSQQATLAVQRIVWQARAAAQPMPSEQFTEGNVIALYPNAPIPRPRHSASGSRPTL